MSARMLIALAALTFTGLVPAIAAETPDDPAFRRRFQCGAEGATDISMNAKYETRGARRKFSTEFEAGPGAGFAAGQRIVIGVDGVNVGSVVLDKVAGGDVVGDLNFDTQPQADAEPFPARFPDGVGRNSVVNVLRGGTVVLGCRLR